MNKSELQQLSLKELKQRAVSKGIKKKRRRLVNVLSAKWKKIRYYRCAYQNP